jgi:mono/diheme cytochrome c family protein
MESNAKQAWWRKLGVWAVVAAALCCMAAADGAWLERVPDAERARPNPYAGQAEAIAAGQKVYEDHCAKCHGDDGTGRRNKPSIRVSRVQHATDGELFWLLKNGSQKKGMPTWSSLPEPTRWQVIAFVKSMGTSIVQRDVAPAMRESQLAAESRADGARERIEQASHNGAQESGR